MSTRFTKEKPFWTDVVQPDNPIATVAMGVQGLFGPYDKAQERHLEKALGELNARAVYASAAANSIATLSREMESLYQITPAAGDAFRLLLQSVTFAVSRDLAQGKW